MKKELSKKEKRVTDKFSSCLGKFMELEKDKRAELEEAGRIWRELGKRFRWWQTLP